MEKVRVGVIGQGRSGFDIHVRTMAKLPEKFRVVAVADPLEERREDAHKLVGARGYTAAEEVLADPEVEMVVVSSPSYLHTPHTMAALKAGKHVLAEKPVSLTLANLDAAIAEAQKRGVIYAPFQQRRYEPHLHKVLEVIRSGVLGRIVQVRLAWHAFSRRWDWQTLKQYAGGQLYNNAPHLIDHGLQLFGDGEPGEIFCDLQRTLASGDAEDHLKIVIKAPGHPTVDMELTAAAAYAQDRWHIMGTAGGLRGSETLLEWKWVDWSKMPERPVDARPTQGRSYNSEALTYQEARWEPPKEHPGNPSLFYEDLWRTLREGRPLAITPQSIRRQIGIIEHCRKACPV